VCHHDPGPNNTVFRDGRPVAFIDFDFAAPGDPLADLGYLAWAWCLSSRPDRGPGTGQARQVRVLAAAYGLTPAARARLPAAIRHRLQRNAAFWQRRLDDEATVATRDRSAEVLAWTVREIAHVDAHRADLVAALS
jgi:aminoglycoside phosphotransferase (APT) family kinase protein